jgi:sugar phosphate isomerase/epimerase
MTILGISSYAYPWAIGVPGYLPPACPMDVFAFVRRASELAVKLVQIADNLPLHTLSPTDLDHFCDEVNQLGLMVEVGIRGIRPAHVMRYLPIAQRLGTPVLRAVIDAVGYRPAKAEIVSTLRDLMPEFRRADVVLALENHDRFIAQRFIEIIEEVNSPQIGVCLDTVNSFGALEGPDIVVETLGPYVVDLHIKDFTIRRADHNMGFIIEGTPAGQGRLNIPEILATLWQYERHFNALIELWPAPETTHAATAQKEDAWVVESIEYLRTLISD